MSKGRDRMVSRYPDGTWENKRNDSDRASILHDSYSKLSRQRSACSRTRAAAT